MRKVIQIVAVDGDVIYALCDDGTIWRYDGAKWKQVTFEDK